MKRTLKIQLIKAVIATAMSVYYACRGVWSKEYFVMDYIISIIWYGLAFLIGISVFWKIYKEYNTTNRKWCFMISFIFLLGITTTLSIEVGHIMYMNYYEKNNVKMRAVYIEDWNGCDLLLKDDGECRINNFSLLGGEYTYYKYWIDNDTIYLNTNKPLGEDSVLESEKMVIKDDEIYFVNSQNDEINKWFKFKIIKHNEDNK